MTAATSVEPSTEAGQSLVKKLLDSTTDNTS
jgi:hypothetical protein